MYRLRNIIFTHGTAFSLQIERLDLTEGGLYALTGANGSGKSTLLRLLALLERQQKGTLSFDGAVVSPLASQQHQMRQQITMVEQSPYLFDDSVSMNIAFGLRLRGLPKRECGERIASGLQQVGLAGFEERHTSHLSGGQRQRVALARALALKPRVLLLDEPIANSDQTHQAVFEQLIPSLRKQGVSILFSSHDSNQCHRLGAEVLHLAQGRLVTTPYLIRTTPRASGKEQNICAQPLKKHAAVFSRM